MQNHQNFDAVGGAPVVMGRPQLGFNPEARIYVWDVTVSGLDGGTWSLEYQPVGSSNWIEVTTGRAENDGYNIDGAPIFRTLKVTFDALGGGAAPQVTINYVPRR